MGWRVCLYYSSVGSYPSARELLGQFLSKFLALAVKENTENVLQCFLA